MYWRDWMVQEKHKVNITLHTSSQWHAESHQRLWRVSPRPRFPGGSYRSCSLAQRHLKQWREKYIYTQMVCCTALMHTSCCLCVNLPVALAYTTLARGSLLCRSSTALPIFVDVAFLALWHSSKIICDGKKLSANNKDKDVQSQCVCVGVKTQDDTWNKTLNARLCCDD